MSYIYFSRITQGEGPLYEMADVVEHTQLVSMIQKTFPELDSEKCNEVYANVLKCVEKKEFVSSSSRTFLLEKYTLMLMAKR